MISGQLGTGQLGAAQLGAYNFLTPAPSFPPPTHAIINSETLNILVLPNYYKMMGRFKVWNDIKGECE